MNLPEYNSDKISVPLGFDSRDDLLREACRLDYTTLITSHAGCISEPELFPSEEEIDTGILSELEGSISRVRIPKNFKDRENLEKRFGEKMLGSLSKDPFYVWVKRQMRLLKQRKTDSIRVVNRFYSSFLPKCYSNWLTSIEKSLISNDVLALRSDLDLKIINLRALSYFMDKLFVRLIDVETKSFYRRFIPIMRNVKERNRLVETRKRNLSSLWNTGVSLDRSRADLWTYLLLSNSETLEKIDRIEFFRQPSENGEFDRLLENLEFSINSFRFAVYTCLSKPLVSLSYLRSFDFEYPKIETNTTGLSAWNTIMEAQVTE